MRHYITEDRSVSKKAPNRDSRVMVPLKGVIGITDLTDAQFNEIAELAVDDEVTLSGWFWIKRIS